MLLPLVMQTLVALLLGMPEAQSPATDQFPFPAIFQVSGLVSVHVAALAMSGRKADRTPSISRTARELADFVRGVVAPARERVPSLARFGDAVNGFLMFDLGLNFVMAVVQAAARPERPLIQVIRSKN